MSLLNVEGRGVQQSHVLLSRTRSFQLLEGTARLVNVDTPPSVWPAIFLSGLHFTSMAMAMMVWVDACAMANPAVADGKGAVIADTQNLYSRLLAVNAMCEFITSSAIGSLSDRFGRRVLAISAQLGQVIDYFMAGLALQPVFTSLQTPTALVSQSLYLSRGVAGLMGNVKISLGAYIADISTAADCPGRLSLSGAATTVGFMLGPVLVGVATALQISYRAIFWLASALNLCNIVVILGLWRDVAPARSFRCRDSNPMSGIAILGTTPALPIFGVITFLEAFSLNMFMGTFTYYAEHVLDFNKTSLMNLALVFGFTSAVFLGVIGPWCMKMCGELRLLQFGFVLNIVFYMGLSALDPGSAWIFFLIVPLFSAGMIKSPIITGLAAREVDPQLQGSLQGALSLLETVGKITAPLLAGEVLIPMYAGEGQYHGFVYATAAFIISPGLVMAFCLEPLMTKYEVEQKSEDNTTDEKIEMSFSCQRTATLS